MLYILINSIVVIVFVVFVVVRKRERERMRMRERVRGKEGEADIVREWAVMSHSDCEGRPSCTC